MKKFTLYMNAYEEAARQLEAGERSLDVKERHIFYGVELSDMLKGPVDYDTAMSCYQFASSIKHTMGMLKPDEFTSLFPAGCGEDGDRYYPKDVLDSIIYLGELNPDEPIKENILEILFMYTHPKIDSFSKFFMASLNGLRAFDTKLPTNEKKPNMSIIPTNRRYDHIRLIK